MKQKSKTSPNSASTPSPAMDFTGSEDFNNMVDLLSVLSAATNDLSELEAEVNDELLNIADERRSRYAKLQTAIKNAEAALELIAKQHPAWFAIKKSIKTPY